MRSFPETLIDSQFVTKSGMLIMCGSRKYPDSHHGGNWKFQEGGGLRGLGNSRREGGWTIK